MNAAKAYRKLKEVEETKLSNRLMLLRLELQKSQRKIEETEKRTQSILEHKQLIEARNRAKVEETRKKIEEQQMAQQINQISRTRMAIIRRTKVKSVAEQKREEAQAVIDARRAHYDAIEQQKEETMKRAMAVKNFVKATLDHGKEQRRREALVKREQARAAFAQRVQSEAAKSKEAEHKVQIMEAEELKLIKLLEATQEYQKGAYNELEGALLSSRQSINTAQEEMKAVMASSLSSRAHSRLRQNEVEQIAVAMLPPMVRKQIGVVEEEKDAGSATPKKPKPPATKKPTAPPGGKTSKPVSKVTSKSASAATLPPAEEAKEETPAASEPAAAVDPLAESPSAADTPATATDGADGATNPASDAPPAESAPDAAQPAASTPTDATATPAADQPASDSEPTPADPTKPVDSTAAEAAPTPASEPAATTPAASDPASSSAQ